MLDLFQYCDNCQTERNFNPVTLECTKCKHKPRNHDSIIRREAPNSGKSHRNNTKTAKLSRSKKPKN
jgi:hypothetical protein